MTTPSTHSVTELLLAWREGDQAPLEKLTSLVYEELRRLAQRYMAGERADHTLQATALVHEAYLRLVDAPQMCWQNRAHFFAVSAQLMRHILVDFARARHNLKREGDAKRVSLDEALVIAQEQQDDLVALDDALSSLAAIDERKSRVVELRFFWRTERQGNGGSLESFARYGYAGLALGQTVAVARDQQGEE